MTPRHWLLALTLIASLTGSLTACGGDPETKPPPSRTTSTKDPSPSASPSEVGGPPIGWKDKFTREQMNSYNAALRRWDQYSKLSSEIVGVTPGPVLTVDGALQAQASLSCPTEVAGTTRARLADDDPLSEEITVLRARGLDDLPRELMTLCEGEPRSDVRKVTSAGHHVLAAHPACVDPDQQLTWPGNRNFDPGDRMNAGWSESLQHS